MDKVLIEEPAINFMKADQHNMYRNESSLSEMKCFTYPKIGYANIKCVYEPLNNN